MTATTWLLLAAILGTFCHWAHGRWTGRIAGNPLDYLIRHPGHTFAMFTATLAAVAVVVGTGTVAELSTETALALGFTTGWTCDSAINKGPER